MSGQQAEFADQGLSWTYATTTAGLKLGAKVDRAVGARTYSFPYQLLAGAAELSVGSAGALASDRFVVPRPHAVGSDGKAYPGGAWRVLPGARVAFDFDDTALPPSAFPYVLDPTTVFNLAVDGDDGFVDGRGFTYPPPTNLSDTASALSGPEKWYANYADYTYLTRVGLFRWDTSSLPDNAVVSAAVFRDVVCLAPSPDNRNLTADWYTAWPVDLTDYSAEPQVTALAGKSLSQLSVPANPDDRTRCLWVVGGGVENDVALDNVTGVSLTGYSGLRLHVSGGVPTGDNWAVFTTVTHPYAPPPRMVVTYAVPPPPPTLVAPATDALLDTLTPTLQVQDQGASDYRFTVSQNGQALATSPWVSTPSWSVPIGVLDDGGAYSWSAVARSAPGANSAPSGSRTVRLDARQLGDRDYYPMQDFALGHGVAASVNAANGNLVVSQTDVSLPTVADPFVISRSYNSRAAGKPVYVDDAVPYGARQAGTWTWDTSRKWSGSQSHKEASLAGLHQHFFYEAQATQFVPYGSSLVTYAYLDPTSAPREVMVQFNVADGSGWEHRAYWGENLVAWGVDGTMSRRLAGGLPASGRWVRLKVAAADVGLEGKVVSGVAYTLYDGQVWFDKTEPFLTSRDRSAGDSDRMAGPPTVGWW